MTKVTRHRPRSFTNVEYARCGKKRDLNNVIVLCNKKINCEDCKAMQAKYRERAKADLDAMLAKPRTGPLRKSSNGNSKKKRAWPGI